MPARAKPPHQDHSRASALSLPVWLTAAIVAVLLHGGALALALGSTFDDDDDLGAPALEVGLELAAPRDEPQAAPVGPDSEASQASPEVAEQHKTAEHPELDQGRPDETDDPDRVVSPNKTETKKPNQQEAVVDTKAAALSLANEATAAPTSQTLPDAPRSTAPSLGSGDSARRAIMTWHKELSALLARNKRYPGDRSQKEARVTLAFTIDRRGQVLASSVAESSGDPAFDQAALAMLARANPLPPPPLAVTDDSLSFRVPVHFGRKSGS